MMLQFLLVQQPLLLIQPQFLRYSMHRMTRGNAGCCSAIRCRPILVVSSVSTTMSIPSLPVCRDIQTGRHSFIRKSGCSTGINHRDTSRRTHATWTCPKNSTFPRNNARIFLRPTPRKRKRMIPLILPEQPCRTFAAWWRGGAGKSSSHPPHHPNHHHNDNDPFSVDVSKKRSYPISIVNDEYRISICSIQGYREYMEDEFMIHTSKNNTKSNDDNSPLKRSDVDHNIVLSDGIVGCFDGHGGKAVSRYLRQNLYTNLLAALNMIQQTKPSVTMHVPTSIPSDGSALVEEDDDDDHETFECHRNDEAHPNSSHIISDENNINHPPFEDSYNHVSGLPSTTTIVPPTSKKDTSMPSSSTVPVASSSATTTHINNNNNNNNNAAASVDDYVSALEVALDKVDREVLKVRHWRHQGSTAIVCWIHTAGATTNENTNTTEEPHLEADNDDENDDGPDHTNEPPTPIVRTLITANIGDSRAILCRNGAAIALSRDHKPNDPIEYQRIHQLGGTVIWDGEVDRMREPIPGMGCYRVNGNLALSRVIGDRSERPVVNSDPDITLITLLPNDDEFMVVATDGLWDVMSSSDTVAFIRALHDNIDQDAIDRESIATYVVEEALRRGSQDNITVIIVWLQ